MLVIPLIPSDEIKTASAKQLDEKNRFGFIADDAIIHPAASCGCIALAQYQVGYVSNLALSNTIWPLSVVPCGGV